MYHRKWVFPGIIILLILIAFPFYWSGFGLDQPFPELEMPEKEKNCIEPVSVMNPDHMRILRAWRLNVVRHDNVVYTSTTGKEYKMSMEETCFGCHKSEEKFCKRCHDYSDVSLPCWKCHVTPEEAERK